MKYHEYQNESPLGPSALKGGGGGGGEKERERERERERCACVGGIGGWVGEEKLQPQ